MTNATRDQTACMSQISLRINHMLVDQLECLVLAAFLLLTWCSQPVSPTPNRRPHINSLSSACFWRGESLAHLPHAQHLLARFSPANHLLARLPPANYLLARLPPQAHQILVWRLRHINILLATSCIHIACLVSHCATHAHVSIEVFQC